ncbi:MAG: type II secretion system F family protein, partial [Anaerolineales bacterium]|nr:type II secretion system F family protein [Anaerolineales bacterium]
VQPIAAEVQQLLDEVEAGKSLMQALAEWPVRTQNRDLDLLVATIKVQLEVGGNLADKLQLLAQIMEKRQLG